MKEKLRTAGTVGLTIAISAGVITDYYAEDPFYIPKIAIDLVSDDGCNTKPLNETVKNPLFPDAINFYGEEDLRLGAKAIADKNGINLIDVSKTLKGISKAKTNEEILEEANKYTDFYNFKFSIPRSYEPLDFPTRYYFFRNGPDLEELRTEMSFFLKNLYFVPSELVTVANIREFKIVKGLFKESIPFSLFSSTESFGKFNGVNRMIYTKLSGKNERDFGEVAMHEIFHAVDFNMCGEIGAIRDREFAGNNPSGFLYGSSKNGSPEFIAHFDGQANTAEDKAYIADEHIFPYLRRNFKNIPPVIQNKILFLVERLDQKVPGYLNYWTELSGFAYELDSEGFSTEKS